MGVKVGSGDFKYEAVDVWPTLPNGARLIETPGVAVDSQDDIYSKMEQTPRIASCYENCPVANVNHYALCYAKQNEDNNVRNQKNPLNEKTTLQEAQGAVNSVRGILPARRRGIFHCRLL